MMKSALVFIFACLLQIGTAFADSPDRATLAKLWNANSDADSTSAKIAVIKAKYPGLIGDSTLYKVIVLGTWLNKNLYYDATGRQKGCTFDFRTSAIDQDFENQINRDGSAGAHLELFEKNRHSANIASALTLTSTILASAAGFIWMFDRAVNDPPKTNSGYYFAAGSVATLTTTAFWIGYSHAASREFHEAVRQYNISIVLKHF